MIAEHFTAFKAAVSAAPNVSGKVFDTARRDASGALIRDTYVVIYGGAPDTRGDDRLASAQQPESDATFVYTVRSVSVTADGCRAIMGAVDSQIVGSKLSVAGRKCDATRQTLAKDVESDDSIQPPLFFGDVEYTVISRRG